MSEVSEEDREKAIEAVVNALGGEALIDPLPSGIALDALIRLGWRTAGAPVVDREKAVDAVARANWEAHRGALNDTEWAIVSGNHGQAATVAFIQAERAVDALIASGVLRSEADVKAEALEEVGNMLLEQYPEDIFVPLTKDANDAINGRLAGSGLSRDALSADIMRFAAKRVLTAAAVLRGDDRG